MESKFMSGQFLLDWAIMAVSLFNTILMLWLGLAVVSNAERRTWGVWLASGGLLLAGQIVSAAGDLAGVEFLRIVNEGEE